MKKILVVLGFLVFILSCKRPQGATNDIKEILPSDSLIQYTGRVLKSDTGFYFSYPGTKIEFTVSGNFCELLIKGIPYSKEQESVNYFFIQVNNKEPYKEAVSSNTKNIKLKGLTSGTNNIKIIKLTESFVGKIKFSGIKVNGNLVPTEISKRRIEFIGNSITCGYGNEGKEATCKFTPETENNYWAYCAVAARQLKSEYHAIAYSGKGMYRNYDGTTKETMSLVYDRYFPDEVYSPRWDYKGISSPDVVVVNLGTNDFAKGAPDSVVFINTYVNFLKRIRAYYPSAYIICMEGPMVTNEYPKDAQALTRLTSYINSSVQVFISKGEKRMSTFFTSVQKQDELGCDYHPNLKKHASMGMELANYIKGKMNW